MVYKIYKLELSEQYRKLWHVNYKKQKFSNKEKVFPLEKGTILYIAHFIFNSSK